MSDNTKKDKYYATEEHIRVHEQLGIFFDSSAGDSANKLNHFCRYIRRQDLSILLARYEIFKKVLDIKGSVVECGVYYGQGLMTWALLSAALEPFNYNRRVIGFDTFSGNAGFSEKDKAAGDAKRSSISQPDYNADCKSELERCIGIYDSNRVLNHIPKVEMAPGDITKSVPAYLKENPYLLVSLLSLTVNLHEPTRAALKAFLPRMSKGSVILIQTLNEGIYPGATEALLESVNLRDYSIQGHPFAPNISYIVL